MRKRHVIDYYEPPKAVPAGDCDVSGDGRWRIWQYAGTKIDAPLLGNGDLLCAFAGPPQWPQFWLTTNDFWQMESSASWEFFHDNSAVQNGVPAVTLGSPRPIGRIVFDIPLLKGAQYHVQQDLDTAHTTAVFTAADGGSLNIKSFVAAGENLLAVTFDSHLHEPVDIRFDFFFPNETGKGCDVGVDFTGGKESPVDLSDTFVGLIGGKPEQVRYRGSLDPMEMTGTAVNKRKSASDRYARVLSGYRAFSEQADKPVKAAFAACFVEGEKGQSIRLLPGERCDFVTVVRTWEKVTRPLEMALSRAAWITDTDLSQLRKQHLAWWHNFWETSEVSFGDPILEQRYDLSHYVMASLSRDPDFPPNILGIATFDRPAWNADYKVNYNHQSPYLGLMSAGYFEQADTADAPYLAMTDICREMSRRLLGHRGCYLPLGLGPKGLVCEALLLHMKSPAVHGALNMMMRWEYTRDRKYASKVYPFLVSVADFWEADLVKDGERYVIVDDSMHERTNADVASNGAAVNPSNTLGYLRTFFRTLPRIASQLAVDADRWERWEEIAAHISPYPIGTLRQISSNPTLWKEADVSLERLLPDELLDLPVFYDEEKGGKWSYHFPGNIMQIYPGGDIGLSSDPQLLQVAYNTVRVHALIEDALASYRQTHDVGMDLDHVDPVTGKASENAAAQRHFMKAGAWNASNLSCLFFPAAVRVGFDPEVIFRELHDRILYRGLPNGFIDRNPHGIENLSTVPNTIQEMMLLSHEGVIRLFKVWPRKMQRDASFRNLWAYGGFQVSASLKDGTVAEVSIISHCGNPCVFENPWPGKAVRIIHVQTEREEIVSGEQLEIEMFGGERIVITQLVTPEQSGQGQ